MTDVCQVELVVSTKLKGLPAPDAAQKVFERFRGCRVLSASTDGARLRVLLLLPDTPGGYPNQRLLRSFVEEGLSGHGVVLLSVGGVREATTAELLNRTLAKRNGSPSALLRFKP